MQKQRENICNKSSYNLHRLHQNSQLVFHPNSSPLVCVLFSLVLVIPGQLWSENISKT